MAFELKEGDRGADVKTLQGLLNNYGANLKVDGKFGHDTTDALHKFQDAHDLDSDGICGDLTWAALGSLPEPSGQSMPTPPVVTSSPATPPPEAAPLPPPPPVYVPPALTPRPATGGMPRIAPVADAVKMIDVSHYNGTIDWPTAWASKSFAAVSLKATQGLATLDKMFATNLKACRALGIPVSAYHYLMPDASIQAQIDFFLRTVLPLKAGDLPLCLDLEIAGVTKPVDLTNKVLQFLAGVAQGSGMTPWIYLSPGFMPALNYDQKLFQYPLWIAEYEVSTPEVPPPWRNWSAWQYAENGTTAGVPGQCDMDIFNGTVDDLQKWRMK